MNIEALVAKHFNPYAIYGTEHLDAIRNALTEQAEAFNGELQAYDGMVRELTKTVEDMQAAQSVPVVGEPVAWVNAVQLSRVRKGYLKNVYLHGESGREIDNLVALYLAPTHSIPAAELATLREKEKDRDALLLMLEQVEQERDELRRALLALKEDCQTSNDCQYGTLSTSHVARIVDAAIDAAIAQGKGE